MTEAEDFLTSQGVKLNPGDDFEQWQLSFKVRSTYIKKYGFAIPNDIAIKTIAAAEPILEVGAGSGYWTYELRKQGVDVIATDPATGRYRLNEAAFLWEAGWCKVEKLTAIEAIKTYSSRTLLVVWPDMEDWPIKALKAYPGKHLFYVGERDGGCTGNDAFHTYLNRHFELIQEVNIPQFAGINDCLFYYQRNETVREQAQRLGISISEVRHKRKQGTPE